MIGKEDLTRDGADFISKLWSGANSHFSDVVYLAKKDANGHDVYRRKRRKNYRVIVLSIRRNVTLSYFWRQKTDKCGSMAETLYFALRPMGEAPFFYCALTNFPVFRILQPFSYVSGFDCHTAIKPISPFMKMYCICRR